MKLQGKRPAERAGGFDIGFNLVSFIVAVVGAVLLLAVVNLVFGRR